jgi:23S rRNA (cytidine1920-2'-O)/16S rRNA (cytidine1409-2'-O)-methyltransferase
MPRRLRLDAELVRRGLARSRAQASDLIADGRVRVGGVIATKPATAVTTDVAVVIDEPTNGVDYVSRGGHKLAGALDFFEPLGLRVADRLCLDAGASTGGFTDVLLRRGAARVLAIDVGYGQLAWALRQDDRVEVIDRTNVRDLTLERIGQQVELVTADLSFISMRLVLPALTSVCEPDGDLVVMVKPQFEVGRERLGKGGVLRDPELRADVVHDVAVSAYELGWGTREATPSQLPGPAGNVEYFLWLRRGLPALTAESSARLVAAGPTGEKVAT